MIHSFGKSYDNCYQRTCLQKNDGKGKRKVHLNLKPMFEQKFDKQKMTESDLNFFHKNQNNPLGYAYFCHWNHKNGFFGPKIAP